MVANFLRDGLLAHPSSSEGEGGQPKRTQWQYPIQWEKPMYPLIFYITKTMSGKDSFFLPLFEVFYKPGHSILILFFLRRFSALFSWPGIPNLNYE